MIIDKEIISKIPQDYFFISGIIDINTEYFKKKIDEGVKNSDNLNYKTNVLGRQTSWKFFKEDEQFGIILLQLIDYLESLNINLPQFNIAEAWGLIEGFGNYTRKHEHYPSYISGALYLNDHHQKLYFPEIKQEIIPQEGRFVLFSSFLIHQTKRNLEHKDKYAISFNFFRNNIERERWLLQ